MRASLCKSSAAFRWLGLSDNGADSGPELRAWENVKRGMCGGNAVYPDDTPESALCPHSSLTMTQALCIYINSVILYCLITSIFLYLSLGSDTSTHKNSYSAALQNPPAQSGFIWFCLLNALVSSLYELVSFYLLGAGRFDWKRPEIPRLWPASTLMSPISAVDKVLCKSHHLVSHRRHPLLLI